MYSLFGSCFHIRPGYLLVLCNFFVLSFALLSLCYKVYLSTFCYCIANFCSFIRWWFLYCLCWTERKTIFIALLLMLNSSLKYFSFQWWPYCFNLSEFVCVAVNCSKMKSFLKEFLFMIFICWDLDGCILNF